MKILGILFVCVLLASCSPKPSDEMAEIGNMVLKEDQGLRIQFDPIPMEKKK